MSLEEKIEKHKKKPRNHKKITKERLDKQEYQQEINEQLGK